MNGTRPTVWGKPLRKVKESTVPIPFPPLLEEEIVALAVDNANTLYWHHRECKILDCKDCATWMRICKQLIKFWEE